MGMVPDYILQSLDPTRGQAGVSFLKLNTYIPRARRYKVRHLQSLGQRRSYRPSDLLLTPVSPAPFLLSSSHFRRDKVVTKIARQACPYNTGKKEVGNKYSCHHTRSSRNRPSFINEPTAAYICSATPPGPEQQQSPPIEESHHREDTRCQYPLSGKMTLDSTISLPHTMPGEPGKTWPDLVSRKPAHSQNITMPRAPKRMWTASAARKPAPTPPTTTSQIVANPILRYKLRLLLHDFRNFTNDRTAGWRLATATGQTWIGRPYFTSVEARVIKAAIVDTCSLTRDFEMAPLEDVSRGRKRRSVMEVFEECVELYYKKRCLGLYRPPLAPDEMAPIFEWVFGIHRAEYDNKAFKRDLLEYPARPGFYSAV